MRLKKLKTTSSLLAIGLLAGGCSLIGGDDEETTTTTAADDLAFTDGATSESIDTSTRLTVSITAPDNTVVCDGQSQSVATIVGQPNEQFTFSSADVDLPATQGQADVSGNYQFTFACNSPAPKEKATFSVQGSVTEAQSAFTVLLASSDGSSAVPDETDGDSETPAEETTTTVAAAVATDTTTAP